MPTKKKQKAKKCRKSSVCVPIINAKANETQNETNTKEIFFLELKEAP